MKKTTRFERFMVYEMNVEFKVCVYFSCILFFYCVFAFLQGNREVSMLALVQMLFTTYGIGLFQAYVLHNFDEADALTKSEIASIVFCTVLYTGASYLFNWFGQQQIATALFVVYMVLVYLSMYLLYKVKREVETKELNNMLEDYKKRGRE